MRLKLVICVTAIAFLSVGCKNTTDEYLQREVCDSSHYEASGYTQQIYCGDGCSMPMWVDTSGYVCDSSHMEPYLNPNYIPPEYRK